MHTSTKNVNELAHGQGPQHRAADKRVNKQACDIVSLKKPCIISCLGNRILFAHGHANLLDEATSDTDGGSNPCGQKPMDFESIPLTTIFMDLFYILHVFLNDM